MMRSSLDRNQLLSYEHPFLFSKFEKIAQDFKTKSKSTNLLVEPPALHGRGSKRYSLVCAINRILVQIRLGQISTHFFFFLLFQLCIILTQKNDRTQQQNYLGSRLRLFGWLFFFIIYLSLYKSMYFINLLFLKEKQKNH